MVYGNIWVALAVTVYVFASYIQLDFELNWYLISFVFCSTLATYNFQRLVRIKSSELSGERIDWLKNNSRLINTLTVIGSIAGIMLSFYLPFEILITYALLGIISFFYAYKYFDGKALRDMPYLKLYLIAFVWALTSASPILYQDVGILYTDWLLVLLEKFLFIVAITIPFDIRDLKYDEAQKRTIPQIFGVAKAKGIAISCLLINLLLADYMYQDSIFYAMIFTNILAGILIVKSNTASKEYHYTFLLDGVPILLGMSVFLVSL